MFYLASNSPRRAQLMALTGWDFIIRAAEVDEMVHPGESPRSYVIRTASRKAAAALELLVPEREVQGLVIACDTAVILDGDILGKPVDPAQAILMLSRLRGRTHRVYSALSVLDPVGDKSYQDLSTTDVPMRAYSDAEIVAYVDSGDPMDKAGAYAIQNPDFDPVENLSGCYANVMGLPLCHLTRTLATLGLQQVVDVPAACQKALSYECPVYTEILNMEIG
jgi:MAF protein